MIFSYPVKYVSYANIYKCKGTDGNHSVKDRQVHNQQNVTKDKQQYKKLKIEQNKHYENYGKFGCSGRVSIVSAINVIPVMLHGNQGRRFVTSSSIYYR